MSEEELLIDFDNHRDGGQIRLGLVVDLRANPTAAAAIVDAYRQRVGDEMVNGCGQSFEEGDVFLQSAARVDGEFARNSACMYLMDFGPEGSEARMHVHPFGERLLLIMTGSEFRVLSLSPIEVASDLKAVARESAPETCTLSGRVVYAVSIEPWVHVSVQIPANTTHRFVGGGTASSIHPNEPAELQVLESESSSMSAQTAFWGMSLSKQLEESQTHRSVVPSGAPVRSSGVAPIRRYVMRGGRTTRLSEAGAVFGRSSEGYLG